MLGSPLGQLRNKPMGFPSTEAMGGADFLDKFPGMARMNPRLDSRSYLDSRSSSPVDSETSGFSSSSDHLSDLLVSLALHVLTAHYCVSLMSGVCASFGSLELCFCEVWCVLRRIRVGKLTLWLTHVLSIGSHPWGSPPHWTLWCPICKKIIWSWRWVSGWTRTTLRSLPHPVPHQLMHWPNAGLGRRCGLAWTLWMLLMRPLVLKGRPGYIDRLLVCAYLACVYLHSSFIISEFCMEGSGCLKSFVLISVLTAVNEATFTWSGQLPPRNYKNPMYSCKVFLGGVPWDITEGLSTLLPFLWCYQLPCCHPKPIHLVSKWGSV